VKVDVTYCGVLKDRFRAHGQEVYLAEGDTVGMLISILRDHFQQELRVEPKLWDSLAVAVNDEYAGLRTRLKDGDDVALLPPVSGGCGAG
jgi:molybdopterin converting factor small subunit